MPGRDPAVLEHAVRLVVGEDPEVERLVRALAHAAPAGGERHGGAGQPHCACSRGELERRLELLARARTRARRACAGASPRARGPRPGPRARRPPAGRAGDLEPHGAQVGHPAEDRLGRRPQREGQRERLERLPGEQRAQLRRRVLALAEGLRDPRRHARGPRGRVALVGQQVQVGEPQVELLGRALDQRGERAHPAVGADRRRAERRRGHQIGVGVEVGMERGVDLEVAHQLDPGRRVRLAEQVHQLVADPRSGDGGERIAGDRLARQPLGLRLEREAEPRGVAHRAQEPGGIVEEAAVVHHADRLRVEVAEPAVRVVQVPEVVAREPDRHRVHGEVAAAEVLGERRGLRHARQLARRVVRLLPRGGEMKDLAPNNPRRPCRSARTPSPSRRSDRRASARPSERRPRSRCRCPPDRRRAAGRARAPPTR